jgi:hypothetical protein
VPEVRHIGNAAVRESDPLVHTGATAFAQYRRLVASCGYCADIVSARVVCGPHTTGSRPWLACDGPSGLPYWRKHRANVVEPA